MVLRLAIRSQGRQTLDPNPHIRALKMSKNPVGVIRIIIIILLLLAGSAIPAAAELESIPSLPTDFSQVDIFLATRDIGHEVYTKYGHTIVRVIDHQNQTDIAYNWGTFDFSAPDYIPKFLQGILIYQMSFGPFRDEVDVSTYEKQTMWMERVNLTSRQKETLLRRIYWQAQPQNINYPYLFFYDNCSTRVRDLFDEALHGIIKEKSFSHSTGKTFRDRVMEHNASLPLAAMGQDVILNSEPDRVMSEWDDMFIPIRLREYLLKMPAVDDQGREIAGQSLLSDSRTLTSYPSPETPAMNGYALFWLLAGVPALLGAMLIRRNPLSAAGIRLVGFANMVLGFIWALFGSFMSLSWMFGHHTVLPRNANLLLMWPIDIVYLLFGLSLARRGQWVHRDGKLWRGIVWCTRAHWACLAIFMVVSLSHLIDQDISRVALWFAPLTAVVFGTVIIHSPKNAT
jgi:Domain of unknown function (DUF4105)